MLGEPGPFPWWLWLLSLLWTGALFWRVRLSPQSDWRNSGILLSSCYAALLLYMTARGALASRALPGMSLNNSLMWGSLLLMLVSISGFAAPRQRWADLALAAACLGLGGLSFIAQAFELAVLCCGAAVLMVVTRATGAHPAVAPRDHWVVTVAATLVCVIWLGLVQYAGRVETQRPGPSRWFTAIPTVEAAARWRKSGRTEAEPAPVGWHWQTLLVAGVCLWMAARRVSELPLESQSTGTDSRSAVVSVTGELT